MKHEMRLNQVPFDAIKSGRQQIETRIYDDKRRQIQVGDQIVFFLRPEEVEQYEANVIGLSIFRSFEDLFKAIYKTKFGYEKDDTLDYQLECMRKYYSSEEEKEFGVVGIHLEITQ